MTLSSRDKVACELHVFAHILRNMRTLMPGITYNQNAFWDDSPGRNFRACGCAMGVYHFLSGTRYRDGLRAKLAVITSPNSFRCNIWDRYITGCTWEVARAAKELSLPEPGRLIGAIEAAGRIDQLLTRHGYPKSFFPEVPHRPTEVVGNSPS